MESIDTYEKLRGEINQIFKEGENLVEGDDFWLDLISDSMEPKEVFEIAKEMKEKGNTFFNSKEFENALEMYGYGITILARYKFQEDSDRAEFCDLALCMLLNSTACFSKLKEFVQVGKICSIILEFQPDNVKAMYRRGVAAIELGRHDMAYWDLVSAAAINPRNLEVVKKLEEVKNFINEKKSKNQNQNDAPKGLGSDLPPPAKKSKHKLGMKQSSQVQAEFQEKESIFTIEEENKGQHVVDISLADDKGSLELPDKQKDDYPRMREEITTKVNVEGRKEGIQEEKVEDNISISNEDDNISSVCTMEENEPVNPAEAMYQFHNRKKQGAMLSISRSSYLMMAQGKSLQYYNAKLGYFMEVRMVSKIKEETGDKRGDCIQQQFYTTNDRNQPSLEKEIQDHAESMETHSEVHSCVTDDGDADDQGDECSSQIQKLFHFSATPKLAIRRKRYEARKTIHDTPSSSTKRNKRRKLTANKKVPSSPTNKICGCRFTQGRKRKCAHPPSLDSYHHPKKRERLDAYGCNPCVCIGHPSYRTSDCNVCGTSIKDIGCVAYDEVSNQSHGSVTKVMGSVY